MFNKSFLVDKIVNSLLTNDFEVFLSSGCFDIAAKRESLMLIKGLVNVDGLNEEQALSLRAVSHFLSAYPLVVSLKTSRNLLEDKMIYSRFELPVVTPKMFEDIVEEEAMPIQSAKGRHTVAVNVETVKEKRKKLGFTLEELSNIVGISKKALYEIENYRVNPSEETVKKLERVLNEDLRVAYELKSAKPTYLKPQNKLQSKVSQEFYRIGIDNSPITSAPFEIVGKEKFTLITRLPEDVAKINREAMGVKKISSMFSSYAAFVVKKTKEKSVEGVPVLLESELPEIDSAKELSKLIEEKA